MAVTYTSVAKNVRMNATRTHFLNGTLRILTAADAVLATFTLSATAGAVAGAGVWTLAFTATSVSAGGTGTAAKADLRTSGAVSDLTGLTVGTSGTDIIIDNTSVNSGQTVQITAATITHAA